MSSVNVCNCPQTLGFLYKYRNFPLLSVLTYARARTLTCHFKAYFLDKLGYLDSQCPVIFVLDVLTKQAKLFVSFWTQSHQVIFKHP